MELKYHAFTSAKNKISKTTEYYEVIIFNTWSIIVVGNLSNAFVSNSIWYRSDQYEHHVNQILKWTSIDSPSWSIQVKNESMAMDCKLQGEVC